MEALLQGREWIAAGRFAVADIMMADVLRETLAADMPGYPNNSRAYIERANGPGLARPSGRPMLTSSLTLRLDIELIANDCWASGLGWERAVSPVRSNFCFWDSAGASSTTDFRREAAACEPIAKSHLGQSGPPPVPL